MSRSLSTRNKRKGFLLLEVLISVTVITVGLVYVVRSFSSSSRAIDTATHFLKSLSLVEEKLWDLEAEGMVEKGRYDGSFEDDQEYSWRLEIEGEKEIPINIVNLKVEWDGPGNKQRVTLETYMYNEED